MSEALRLAQSPPATTIGTTRSFEGGLEIYGCGPREPQPGELIVPRSCVRYFRGNGASDYVSGELIADRFRNAVTYLTTQSGRPISVDAPPRDGPLTFFAARTTYGCYRSEHGSIGTFFPRNRTFVEGPRAERLCKLG